MSAVTRLAGVFSFYIMLEFTLSSLSGVLPIPPASIGGDPPRHTTFFRGQLIGVWFVGWITTEDMSVFKGLGRSIQFFCWV
jgi:hypothetical protein